MLEGCLQGCQCWFGLLQALDRNCCPAPCFLCMYGRCSCSLVRYVRVQHVLLCCALFFSSIPWQGTSPCGLKCCVLLHQHYQLLTSSAVHMCHNAVERSCVSGLECNSPVLRCRGRASALRQPNYRVSMQQGVSCKDPGCSLSRHGKAVTQSPAHLLLATASTQSWLSNV
jgi:hypothetical protein